MTQTTDKERYLCLNCFAVAELTTQLRCQSCGSDSVVSTQTIQSNAPVSRPESLYPPQLQRIPVERSWYHIKCGLFETVVPYTKAENLDEALAFAKSSNCEWYFVDTEQREPLEAETLLIDHSEFLEWCRGKWL